VQPAYNTNILIKKFLPNKKRLYLASGVVFMLLFFATRPVYLTFITGIAWLSPGGMDSFIRPAPVVGAAMLGLTVLNFWWFYKIVVLIFGAAEKLDEIAPTLDKEADKKE